MWDVGTYLIDMIAASSGDPGPMARVARETLLRVARVDVSKPGFALIRPEGDLSPAVFRSLLVSLAEELDSAYQERFGRRLVLYWMGRFSQQRTTEAHLDGAPDESVLILGYEPTEVASRLVVYDYARAALDRSMQPKEFLERLNPTFGEGRAAIEPYRTDVERFDPREYNVLVLNNSSGPADRRSTGMLGVLHQSMVPVPDAGRSRYINTLMLRTGGAELSRKGCGPSAVEEFVESAAFQSCG